jgi:tetratricopeptide (TPR) repeat protein
MKEHFGDVFAEYVKRMELTAGRLAKLTNISCSTIESWLEGRVRRPRRWQDIVSMAAALRLGEEDANRLLQASGWPTVTQFISQAQIEQDTDALNQLTYWLALRERPPKLTNLPQINGSEIEDIAVHVRHERIPEIGMLPPGSHLPLTPNPFFVGRQAEMHTIAQALVSGESVVVNHSVALIGLGGIGKTQLAVEFAHRYGRFFTGGVFWINFFDPATIPKQIALCGDAQHLDLQPNFDTLPLNKQVKLVHRAWQEAAPRLLIFDACEDEASLHQWRPTTGGCRVIVTSRRARWSPELGIISHSLALLSRSEGQNLLRLFRDDLTEVEAGSIAQKLGDLPLALHLAGNFLRTYCHDISSSSYLTQLQNLQTKNILTHPSLRGYGEKFSPTGQELNVGRTIALSYEKLDPEQESDALALALLARASAFAPGEPIPRSLLTATVSAADPNTLQIGDALTRLVNLGLVSEGVDGSIRVHQLVASFVQVDNYDRVIQSDVETAILGCVQDLEETLNPAPLRILESHWRYVTTIALSQNNELAGQLGHYLAIYLWLDGLYDEAQEYCERVLSIRKKIKGINHLETADSLNILGVLLKEKGLYEAALPYYEQALLIRENLLGTEHRLTAKSLNNIGSLLLALRDFEGACTYYERSLAIKEKVLGSMHQEVATTLNNLGCLLFEMGDYKNAQIAQERALTIDEDVFGSEHPQVGMSLYNLGVLLQRCNSHEKAGNTLERALTIFEKTLDAEHPLAAKALYRLGVSYRERGLLEKSVDYLVQALAIRKQKLGIDHPDTADILNTLQQWGVDTSQSL